MRSRPTAAIARVSVVAMLAIAGCARDGTANMTPASLGANEREILSAREAQNQRHCRVQRG